MVNIVLYGNCQITIGINSYLDYLGKYNIKILSSFNIIYGHTVLDIDLFKNCDIFIYQPIDDRYGIYSTNNILKYFKNDCILVSVPFIYMDSLFPLVKKLSVHGIDGGIQENENNILNNNVILNYKKIYNNEEIINLYKNNKIDFDFQNRFDENIKRMKEKEEKCNIKIVDFILDNYKKNYLFTMHHHPTKIVFDNISKQIYKLLNINNNITENKWNGILSDEYFPYSRYSINYYKFSYITEEDIEADNYYLELIKNIINY
jgi:hypothetical protein